MKTQVDILRNEQRFLILPEMLPEFLAEISTILGKKVFSAKRIARTIYFNNNDYPIPWGYSLKARKFLEDFSQEVYADSSEIYRGEVKSTVKGDSRLKIQRELPLGQLTQFFNSHLSPLISGINLRPYGMDEYFRTHFVSKEKAEPLRLTIDRDVRYGFFEEISEPALEIGKEDFIRIELKVVPGYQNSAEYQRVIGIISKYSPLPVISKREYLFFLIGLILGKKGKSLYKELKDYEIETKFLVRHANPAWLLLSLKRYFQGSSENYYIPEHYPYSQEGTTINHYWSRKDKDGKIAEGLKLMFIGRKVKPVKKKDTRLLSISGLGSLLQRDELKDLPFLFTRKAYEDFLEETERELGELEYIGYLHRSRRAFWPENKKTGRIYHVSLDRCRSLDGRVEWQMEVEYTGRYLECPKESNQEKIKSAIRAEVAELSKETLSFCNSERRYLIPTTLTKFHWLRGQT